MLEPDGQLILECPDLEKVSRLCLIFADDPEYLDKGAFGFRGFFGARTPTTSGDYHKWGYTPSTAAQLIKKGGFCTVRSLMGFPTYTLYVICASKQLSNQEQREVWNQFNYLYLRFGLMKR